MVTTPTEVAHFKPSYQSIDGAGTAFSTLREQGFARFSQTGMPTARRGNERWKYTNVAPIARTAFAPPAPAEVDAAAIMSAAPAGDGWHTIVFVNGRYTPGLSSPATGDGVAVTTLADAAADNAALVQRHLGKYAPVSADDGFGALNTAFLTDGAFVHITGEHDIDQAIHLLFVTTESERPVATHPRTLVIADRHSRATLVETYLGLSANRYFTNAVAEIALEDGASLNHYRVMHEGGQAFHIGTTRIRQAQDTTLRSLSFAFGGELCRNDLHVLLDAPGAECTLNGLYMTAGKELLDNHISLTHAKPHATSRQLYKGILTDNSRAVFSGQVRVEPDAQKTYAEQKDMNLILSDGAEVDTKPSLLIYADDVQCFHGAAAGEADEDWVFYMMSRGLDKDTASNLLISAFANEIIDQVETEALREYIASTVEDLLPAFKF